MKILAIESSCDDSGITILENNDKDGQPKILADLISSQIKIHAKWGGVVPMLAKREHQKNLVPLLKKALQKNPNNQIPIPNEIPNSKIQTLQKILEREPELLKKLLPFLQKHQKPNIDYIAITHGPGLEPALWVGVNLARALSFIWNLPILPINHIEGHIIANLIPSEKISKIFNFQFFPIRKSESRICDDFVIGTIFNENKKLKTRDQKLFFPAMCLVVSGGHTQLILIKKLGEYEIIGETRDDAAGEAFDKVAKMLGLGYPGGPIISQLTDKWKSQISISNFQTNTKSKIQNNHPDTQSLNHLITKSLNPFSFPRPMMNSGDFDFSFSGLKTAVLYTLQKMAKAQIKKATPAIAAAFQQAVVDVLVQKTINSAKKYETKSIWLSGGVAANQALRQSLKQKAQENNFNFMTPPSVYCADNATMIALAAFYQLRQNRAKEISWQDLKAEPNLRIS